MKIIYIYKILQLNNIVPNKAIKIISNIKKKQKVILNLIMRYYFVSSSITTNKSALFIFQF